MISPNKIIGSLTYRTMEALNRNKQFMCNLQRYAYWENCLVGGRFYLWHYPGVHSEISNVLLKLDKLPIGKFPAILDFHNVRQYREGLQTTIYPNLAIAAIVNRDWLLEQREAQDMTYVLRPIYEEFVNQILSYEFFTLDYGIPDHNYYEVFTTGEKQDEIINRYGDHIDAIEMHNLGLRLRIGLCDRDYAQIDHENCKVTQNIKNLLNL